MIKILIAEDSLTITNILQKIFLTDRELFVVGTARNGKEALEKTIKLHPDVVTMDIRMPLMNGFEATKAIMTKCPTPILVVSASVGDEDLNIAFNAIQAGALEIVEKPQGDLVQDYERIGANLIHKVKLVAGIKVFHHVSERHINPRIATKRTTQPSVVPPKKHLHPSGSKGVELVAIAASTGGPSALLHILKDIPANFPIPILVVQHISQGFGQGFVDWLNKECRILVKTAEKGEQIKGGTVYVAPDDFHMLVSDGGIIRLNKSLPLFGLRPAADITFESVAQYYGDSSLGIILTGMGRDGSQGLKLMKEKGSLTIAQDESTSVVFGMPKEAIDLGIIDQVLPIEWISKEIKTICSESSKAMAKA